MTQADLEGRYKEEWESQVSRWVYGEHTEINYFCILPKYHSSVHFQRIFYAYVDAYDAAMKGGACRNGLHMIFYEKLRKVDSDEKN